MYSESDANRATFEQGLAAMEGDSSYDSEQEYELVEVDDDSEELETDLNPYKRFKTDEGSVRQV